MASPTFFVGQFFRKEIEIRSKEGDCCPNADKVSLGCCQGFPKIVEEARGWAGRAKGPCSGAKFVDCLEVLEVFCQQKHRGI